MYIEITNPKGMIEVDDWFKKKRKANGNKISPEIAMETLSFTNNYANIKTILRSIEALETTEEKKQFKQVIFSMIEGRESTPDTIVKMEKIAEECGFLDEFEKHKVYCNGLAKSSVPIYHERYPRILKVATLKELVNKTFSWWEEKMQDVLICEETDDIHVCADTQILWDKLPSVCIFPNAENVELYRIKGIKQLRLKEGCVLSLTEMYVPNDVEFEKCKVARFDKCSFANVDSASFGDRADVLFYKCKNMPRRVDLSMCKSVNFGGSDFSEAKKIKLKDGRMKEKFKNDTMYSLDSDITTLEEDIGMMFLQKSL